MNRHVEETVKSADTSRGYPCPSSPLPPPRLPPGTLPTVGQPIYAPTLKPTGNFQSVQGFPTFTTTMPESTSAIQVQGEVMTPLVSASATATQKKQNIHHLKEKDAITYLDQVKFKFEDQPQVYSDFLAIMKDFRSQSIDIPTVIDRVTHLFKGHPEMTVGFNTFLPPQYKIEVKTNKQGNLYQVQVTIPSAATTTLVTAAPAVYHTAPLPTATLPVSTTVNTQSLMPTNTDIVTLGNHAAAVTVAAVAAGVQPPLPPPVPATPPHFTNHSTPSTTQLQTHQVVTQTHSHVESHQSQHTAPQSQPVDFNHAIIYVNKIKDRFQGQPSKYKRFLEILDTYQKAQRNLKESSGAEQTTGTKQLTEADVYSQVSKLFEHHDDLLAEFGRFLPDAINHQTQLAHQSEEPIVNRNALLNVKISASNNTSSVSSSPGVVPAVEPTVKPCSVDYTPSVPAPITHAETSLPQESKRSSSITLHSATPSTSTRHVPLHPPAKKHKPNHSYRGVSLSEALEYGTLSEFGFFDKVHKALGSQKLYDNFLRCLSLYNWEIISLSELQQLTLPFLRPFPELVYWFKEFLDFAESPPVRLTLTISSPSDDSNSSSDSMLNNINRQSGGQSEIDFSSYKRLGASYCALPENCKEKCSGRTALCKEVLNDTWISIPNWTEEAFVPSRKTQYEEYIYKCEDERFELDMVMEVNLATIRVLEGVQKKLCRLTPEEVDEFQLDDCLGGSSPTIHQRAILRIYGDKGHDIIDGLKKNPFVAVPVVLRRLKAKDEEWREALKGFNKIWRGQNEKNYLKALGIENIRV